MTTERTTAKELEERCKEIAAELNEIINGDKWKCPHCGDIVSANTDSSDGESVYYCAHCGEELNEDDDRVSFYTYFDDVLDIEYRINSRCNYVGVVLTVAVGGPHIDIDTREREVKGYWGGDRASWGIFGDVADDIDTVFEEHYNSVKGA